MRRAASIVILTCLATASPLRAADRVRIRNLNVTLQPIFTVVSAALQGKLNGSGDWLRCITSGAAAGYVFYDAKARAGRGFTTAAWIEGNAAASLSMNAAAGRNPFSRLRLTLGPLRAEVTTPFETNPNAAVHLSSSIAEIGALAMAQQHRKEHVVFRSGRVAFRTTKAYCEDGRCYPGYTIGSFSGTIYGASSDTWPHETVHALQAIQGDSLEPPTCAYFRRCSAPPAEWKVIRFDGFDLGLLLATAGYLDTRQPYVRRAAEIEAWRLAERIPPPP
jgi:hypothetical protein